MPVTVIRVHQSPPLSRPRDLHSVDAPCTATDHVAFNTSRMLIFNSNCFRASEDANHSAVPHQSRIVDISVDEKRAQLAETLLEVTTLCLGLRDVIRALRVTSDGSADSALLGSWISWPKMKLIKTRVNDHAWHPEEARYGSHLYGVEHNKLLSYNGRGQCRVSRSTHSCSEGLYCIPCYRRSQSGHVISRPLDVATAQPFITFYLLRLTVSSLYSPRSSR